MSGTTHRRGRLVALAAAAACAVGITVPSAAAAAPTERVAQAERSAQAERVDVIVQLRPGADVRGRAAAVAADAASRAGGSAEVTHVYTDALTGFAATLPRAAITAQQRNPHGVA
ncbi:MAG: hypothetical protein H5T83_10345, partial [Actinotalea sp.]|nr:hypothetical protein [Actinotalea sp.]